MPDKMTNLGNRIVQMFAGARMEVTTFPSGAAMLDIWRSNRLFVMCYGSSGRIGVDEVLEDEGFEMGYRYLFDDFESASAKMLQLVSADSAKKASA